MLSNLCSKLGLDLVPREGPLAVDPHSIGIVKLYNVHVSSADNAKASSVSGKCLPEMMPIRINLLLCRVGGH